MEKKGNFFLKVKCSKCGNEQIIYEKATTRVECFKCKNLLARPGGGKAKINAKIVEKLK